MFITITDQNPIMQDPTSPGEDKFYTASERAPADNDSMDFQYQKVRYSNGFEQYIKLSWGADVINACIQATIAAFDSDNPPRNWSPYPGFVPAT